MENRAMTYYGGDKLMILQSKNLPGKKFLYHSWLSLELSYTKWKFSKLIQNYIDPKNLSNHFEITMAKVA